jgi:hypothetical protein
MIKTNAIDDSFANRATKKLDNATISVDVLALLEYL